MGERRRTLVRGTAVLDGNGGPPRAADLVLCGEDIEAVAPYRSVEMADDRVIDCGDAWLTPGFVDVHSHADGSPLLDDPDTSKVLQGVTLEVVGNCGFSLAPYANDRRKDLQDCLDRLFPAGVGTWSTISELIEAMTERGSPTNMVTLVGHHALRAAVLGSDGRPATPEENRRLRDLARRSFDEGAAGLSSGLIYTPGLYATRDELAAVASALPEGRPYTTHLRSEGVRLEESLDEAIEVARRAGCRLHVSHLKSLGRRGWGVIPRMLDKLDRVRDSGLEITVDMYPYTAASTMLAAALPPWVLAGGRAATLARLRERRVLDRIRGELELDDGSWENAVAGAGWDGLIVASTRDHVGEGRSLQAIAQDAGAAPFEVLVDILVRNELEATMIMHAMAEEDVRAVMACPWAMIGSDGLPLGVGGKPHPRTFGTFPRVLARYVRDQRAVELPDAVRRMTSLPADTFGLAGRGRLVAGNKADMVCFDLESVHDRATFDDPARPPDGIRWVMRSGKVVAQDGRWLGDGAGRWLRAGRPGT